MVVTVMAGWYYLLHSQRVVELDALEKKFMSHTSCRHMTFGAAHESDQHCDRSFSLCAQGASGSESDFCCACIGSRWARCVLALCVKRPGLQTNVKTPCAVHSARGFALRSWSRRPG